MKRDLGRHRIAGTIGGVNDLHDNEHGGLTTWVTVQLGEGGSSQGFGGLMLDKNLGASYVQDLCAAFGVKKFSDLKGEKCYALYSFGEFNEHIEGLESVKTGMRFLHNVWRRKHFPETASVFSQKLDSVKSTIEWAECRLRKAKNKLLSLKDQFVDWEEQ